MLRMPKVVAVFAGAIVALAATGGSAKAATFDTFGNAQGFITADPPSSNGLGVSVNVFGGPLNVTRTIALDVTAGADLANMSINIANANQVKVNNGTNTSSASISYPFPIALNFSTVGTITLMQAIADLANSAGVRVGFDTNNDGSPDVFTNGGAFTTIPTSLTNLGLTVPGGLTTVFGMYIQMQTTANNTDYSFGPIEMTNLPRPPLTPDQLPEPMTLATLGFMALAGGVVTRRKLKNRVVA